MIVITGPTSSGKTSLAIKLCKEFNGEIISADSRQVFKYMDVGTGKMPIGRDDVSIKKNDGYWIVDGVKIHMYDVIKPDEYYSASDFKKDTRESYLQIKSTRK